MVEKEVTVKLKTGLQARPAALFVQAANRFSADVFLKKDNKVINAKSIMGLMSLALSPGATVIISADGNDENAAVETLAKFIEAENN